jgi:3-dehydroquinate synthase
VDWCEEHAEDLLQLNLDALEYGIYEGCKVKSIVVSQDEREGGIRAILNLGHTFGHAFEAVAGYGELVHGEAIAIGMVCAAQLSVQLGHSEDIFTTTDRIFRKFGLPVRIPSHMDTDAIMGVMMHDKKFKEGSMVFIVPVDIGTVEINSAINSQTVRAVLEAMKGEA